MKLVNEKILDLLEILKKHEIIRYDAEFCRSAGIFKSYLIAVRKGKNNFTPEHIKNICVKYRINANWIFGTQEEIFLNFKENGL